MPFLPDILPCIVGGIFWRKVPRVPCPSRRPSVRPARSHSLPEERLLPDPPRHPSLPGVSLFWRFCCYLDLPPILHGLLWHPPLPGVSLFRCFRCYLDRPPALHGLLRHPSPPGVSLFRRFRSYLNSPPAMHDPLRHLPPPGMSLFRCFRCYLDRPHARHGPLRCPPLPGVSRFRRIGSHLRRVTQASRPGTMAAGAREQAASCDAFVLSRRQLAPDAPPSRTSPLCLIAKSFPEPSPNHGPVTGRDCRCEFRPARSRAPLPDSVMAVVGMTDGVWQGG